MSAGEESADGVPGRISPEESNPAVVADEMEAASELSKSEGADGLASLATTSEPRSLSAVAVTDRRDIGLCLNDPLSLLLWVDRRCSFLREITSY